MPQCPGAWLVVYRKSTNIVVNFYLFIIGHKHTSLEKHYLTEKSIHSEPGGMGKMVEQRQESDKIWFESDKIPGEWILRKYCLVIDFKIIKYVETTKLSVWYHFKYKLRTETCNDIISRYFKMYLLFLVCIELYQLNILWISLLNQTVKTWYDNSQYQYSNSKIRYVNFRDP